MPSIIDGPQGMHLAHAGRIIDIHYHQERTSYSQAVTNYGRVPVTNLEVVLTPQSADNIFIIFCRWNGESTGSEHDAMFGVSRNDVEIGNNDAVVGYNGRGIAPIRISHHTDGNSTQESASYHMVDAPATTDELTYKLIFYNVSNAAKTLYTNRVVNAATTGAYERTTSGIHVLEINPVMI